ncbi:MAG: N-acetylmuramoyl-L-alanine amidase [Chthoniobacterales bacterium]
MASPRAISSPLRLALVGLFSAFLLFLGAGCEYSGSLGPGRFDTVIVDAGHGGHDSGARSVRGSNEKALALDTAKRLAGILRRRGFRVIETRTSDYFVTLGRRVAISNETRNSIFVSVHYNWTERSSARGLETYYYSPQSQLLANKVQRELAKAVSSNDRGVKRRGFYVLRKNRRPAILVECGFVSNPSDNATAQSASGRQRIAEAIARGIIAARQ